MEFLGHPVKTELRQNKYKHLYLISDKCYRLKSPLIKKHWYWTCLWVIYVGFALISIDLVSGMHAKELSSFFSHSLKLPLNHTKQVGTGTHPLSHQDSNFGVQNATFHPNPIGSNDFNGTSQWTISVAPHSEKPAPKNATGHFSYPWLWGAVKYVGESWIAAGENGNYWLLDEAG